MKIIRHFEDILNIRHHEPCGIAIGTFDGLHIGHRQVIRTLLEKCRAQGLKSVVYTFANHPREFTDKEANPNRIISVEDKIDLFDAMGIDELIMVEFDEIHMGIDAELFVRNILCGKLNMRCLVAGYNFRFGAGAQGDSVMLSRLAEPCRYAVHIVDQMMLQGEVISSSRIRQLLEDGDIEGVNRILGRHHSLSGLVISGKRVGGKELGFPTANLKLSPNMALMKPGVYITRTHIGKELHHSVTNVGYNPTYDQKELNVETHILRFKGDLYHRYITVEFLHRLRGEVRFDDKAQLIAQIRRDIEGAELYFKALHHHGTAQ